MKEVFHVQVLPIHSMVVTEELRAVLHCMLLALRVPGHCRPSRSAVHRKHASVWLVAGIHCSGNDCET